METVPVNLPDSPYTIRIASEIEDLTGALSPFLAGRRIIVLTTPRVRKFCLPALKKALRQAGAPFETLLLPDGERHKNLATASRAYRGLIRLRADRNSLVLLLGGGVLGGLG